MMSVEYDLDVSGGLMPQIQALIAPPSSEDGTRRYRRHKKLKKLGAIDSKGASGFARNQTNKSLSSGWSGSKTSNHEYCDFCREGGDLLCCDRCPAAFHLQCNDPPLDEDDVPPGDWLCRRCKVIQEAEEEEAEEEPNHGVGRERDGPFSEMDAEEASDSMYLTLEEKQELEDEKEMVKKRNAEIESETRNETEEGEEGEKEEVIEKVDEEVEETGATNDDRDQVTAAVTSCESSREAETKSPILDNNEETNGSSDHLKSSEEAQNTGHPEVEPMEAESQSESIEDEDQLNSSNNPLTVLIKAAKMINPKQFNLPNEYSPSVQLPGTSKGRPVIVGPKSVATKKTAYELDNGLVPLPVKTCFLCRRSCRKSPLIQCDFCPLLFHPDCLDPPLTALPTTRWMCPNHAEHALEQKLLSSSRLSERVRLWSKFNGRVSQDAVKLQFLRKVHRQNPPFRCKERAAASPRVSVPNAIKELYRTPPALLPTNYVFVGSSDPEISQRLAAKECDAVSASASDQPKSSKPTPREQEEWLSSVVSLQSSIADYLNQRKCNQVDNNSRQLNVKTAEAFESMSSSHRKHFGTKCNGISLSKEAQNEAQDAIHGGNHFTKEKTPDEDQEVELIVKNEMIGRTDVKLAQAQDQAHGRDCSPTYSYVTSSPPSNNSKLIVGVDSVAGIDLSKLDEKVIRALALQRLQQLLPSTKPLNNCNIVPPASPALSSNEGSPNTSAATSNSNTTVKRICLGDVKARAVLCPIFMKAHEASERGPVSGPAVAMSYRTLTIGNGADNDVVLNNYGHCNFVSSKQACIFYDEGSKRYELINYSEHGTTVDNVLFSCDFSGKRAQDLTSCATDSSTVAAAKHVIKRARKRKLDKAEAEAALSEKSAAGEESRSVCKQGKAPGNGSLRGLKKGLCKKEDCSSSGSSNVERVSVQVQAHNTQTMSCKSGQVWTECACKSSGSTIIGGTGAGWEGPALLHHGSYIKMGCIQFVFSITNYGMPSITTATSSPSPSASSSTSTTVTANNSPIGSLPFTPYSYVKSEPTISQALSQVESGKL